LKKWLQAKFDAAVWKSGVLEHHDIVLRSYYLNLAAESKNPIHKDTFFGGFSQLDEYCIVTKILHRLPPIPKSFVEFGVGTGTENNTLGLILDGWNGVWVGNEKLTIEVPDNVAGRDLLGTVNYVRTWVDLQTLQSLSSMLQDLDPSLISMDLDGNDYHFTEYLLSSGLTPKIYVQEYNANFGPHIKWIMPYKEGHQWQLDTNWGASLAAYVALFQRYGYTLVACSLSGVNAFFVQNAFYEYFSDIPKNPELIFHSYTPWFSRTKQSVSGNILRKRH
jgi:hypothetical protein